MNFKKKSFVVIILFFTCGICLAQLKPGLPNDLDKKFTPDKTSVLNNTGSASGGGSSSNNNSSEPDFVNVVKCNLTLIPRSIFALSYERFLTDQVSVEGSLGVAYNKDQIFGLLGSELDLTAMHTSKVSLRTIYSDGKKGGIGVYTGGSIKFHFTGGCYSNYYGGWGWGGDADTYLELGVRYYTNSIQMTNDAGSANNNSGSGLTYYNNPLVSVRQLNYLINYGYRFTTSGKIKTSHELYMGAGLRNITYDVFATRTVNNFPAQYDEYYLTGARESSSGFLFVMGYILGFGF